MKNASITIGVPYISHECESGKVRLCANIKRPDKEICIWFEVQDQYEKYLCTERSNSFLLAILEYAMSKGWDICSETPIDSSLHYQLTNYGTTIIGDNYDFLNRINLDIPFTDEIIESDGGVGTGFSGGVDSFYTVLKHMEPEEHKFKLTHLLIANIGAFTYGTTEETTPVFLKKVDDLTPAANDLGLPLIVVNTNFNDFYHDIEIERKHMNAVMGGSITKISAVVYALQKLFRIYYIASSLTLDRFQFAEDDSCYNLLYWLKLYSIPSLMFYGSGSEVNRIGKVEYISDYTTAQKYLGTDFGKNCGNCFKCLRTQGELYAVGKLDKFEAVYDVKKYVKNYKKKMAWYLGNPSEWEEGFPQEIRDTCKKYGRPISIDIWILSFFIYKPLFWMKQLLRKNKTVRKIYYHYNLDEKIYGSEIKAMRSAYLTEEKERK